MVISHAELRDQRVGTPQPWNPADATDIIRAIAASAFDFHLTHHAKEQMELRGLTTSDILHLLKHGFVYEEAEASTRKDLFKYKLDGMTPNSENRALRIVVLPCTKKKRQIKIITVMWRDEASRVC
jgi:hypothetical protein